MPVTCPAGHESATADYCDTCGQAIDAAGAGAPGGASGPVVPGPVPGAGVPGPVPAGPTCPECGSARGPDDAFCEVCGLHFATGARPAPPPPPPAAAAAPVAGWTAVVAVDPDFYATHRTDDPGLALPLPEGVTGREIPLTAGEVRIGRGEDSAGIRPEIDLSLPPGDPGVSHRHAVLSRRGDGWVVVDQGSTNGTRVGTPGSAASASALIAPRTEVVLHRGDHLLVGVWTRITLREAGP